MKTGRVSALLIFCVLALSACAHVVSPGLREEARNSPAFPSVLGNPSAYVGATVIWGGVIVDTRNRKDGGTTLTILETPLDDGEMPAAREYSRGRFLAVTPLYLDPAIYRRGIRITVAGKVVGNETRPVGEMEYRYPILKILESHIWKKTIVMYGGPYYSRPYGYPYGWWGSGPAWDEDWVDVPARPEPPGERHER